MKNALLLTGAAARISQEVALLDKLIEKKGLEIKPDNTMLAGFSSGALNIGAINSCFKKEQALSWDNYYKQEILFKLETKNIFTINKFVPVNTTPLRNLISSFFDMATISKLHDCSFDSFVLAFSIRRLTTVWASNCYNRHKEVNITDLLMASSAIPIIFPDQTINVKNTNRTKHFIKGSFVDGGTGGSFKKFEKHLKKYTKQKGQFENLYIISPMRQISDEDFDELSKLIPAKEYFRIDLKDLGILKIFLEMISQNGFDTFVRRLNKWTLKNKIAENIFICIPEMEDNYPLLNFDKQKAQYDSVCKWVDENPDKLAIPLNEYVKRFEKEPLREITRGIRRKMIHRVRSIINR